MKDPIIPSVRAIEDLQECVNYWGDRCCRMEAALQAIADLDCTRLDEAGWIARRALEGNKNTPARGPVGVPS